MKYNIGDKVRVKSLDWYKENKDKDGNIPLVDHTNSKYNFIKRMRGLCGKVMTISNVNRYSYDMVEDNGEHFWTDEMIEGLVDEECPQDFNEKYCKSCGTQRCDRTKEFLDGCPYYNEYMSIKQNNAVEEETKPKYEDEVNGEYYSTPKYLVRPSGYQFVDENGNVINAQKIILEKKKKEYPKTFEECVHVLEGENRMSLEQMNTFRKLIDARNAYWTIYGEENGLGKPWEPVWDYDSPPKHIISCHSGVIIKAEYC